MADGSLKFDTKIDTDGFEKGINTLEKIMGRLSSAIEDLSINIKNAFSGVSTTETTKVIDDTKEAIDRTDDSAKRMEESMKNIDDAIARMNSEAISDIVSENEVAAVRELSEAITEIAPPETIHKIDEIKKETSELGNAFDFIKQTVSSIPGIFATAGNGIKDAFASSADHVERVVTSADDSNQKIKALVDELDRYKDALYHLEGRGLYFGDKEYDDAYRGLKKAESALVEYKRELMGLDSQQKRTTLSTRKLNETLRKTAKTSIPLTKSIFKLSNMFKLLVIRMVMRAVIRSVQEGFRNLAQYSNQANRDISALKTSMQTLQNSFATAFAPILTAVTPALQTLIGYLSQAITTMGQFFAVLFTGATTFTKAKDAQVDYAKSLAKTAKEANKSLSPIDKLNNVGDNGGGGGYEAPGPGQMFEEVEIDNKMIDKVERLKNLLKPVIDAFGRLKKAVDPFAKNVGEGLKWMYDNVLVPFGNWTITELIPSFLDTLGASIGVLNSLLIAFQPWGAWLWENFLQPLASWAGETIINGLDSLTVGLNNLSTWILENQELVRTMALIIAGFFAAFKIAEFIAFIAPFVGALAEMISSGTLLSGMLGGISTTLSTLAGPVGIAVAAIGLLIYSFIDLYKNSEDFRQSISDMYETWTTALQPLADFVGGVLSDAWDKILKPIIDFFIETLLPNLIDTFKNLWENVLVPLGDFIGTVLQPVFQVLSDLLSMLWEHVILPLAEAIGGVLKKAWDGLYQILNKTIIPIIRKAIDVLKFLWEKVINPIIKVLWDNLKPAFESVFGAIGDVLGGFGKILGGLIDFIAGVFTGDWKKAWDGIKNIFTGIWDAIWGALKGVINAIISLINGLVGGVTAGINAVIRALNKINFDIPEWVPVLGGKSFGFNMKELTAPKIPKLASGTVVPANYGEFLAILGDNKREAEVVSPLSTMKQALKEAMTEMGGAGTGTINLNVYLEGRQIHSEVVRQDKQYRNETGKSAFAY